MKRRLLSVLLACTLITGILAGCSGNSNTSTTSTEKADEEESKATQETSQEADAGENGDVVEIRFTWWGDTTRNEMYNQICDRFEEANPDIKVIRESGSWNDYWDKLATQVAGGNAPDVISMHVQYISPGSSGRPAALY